MSTDRYVGVTDENIAQSVEVALQSLDDDVISAAGCVVYRQEEDGPKILVVHRPRYDDWDLPKGKREANETDLECAVRETKEESGYDGVIERELQWDTYRVRGRDKLVRWFLMRCTAGDFEPNDEVDEIRWLSPDAAREILSYGHARSLVDVVDNLAAPDGSGEEE